MEEHIWGSHGLNQAMVQEECGGRKTVSRNEEVEEDKDEGDSTMKKTHNPVKSLWTQCLKELNLFQKPKGILSTKHCIYLNTQQGFLPNLSRKK
jgi:hypothetical protein